MANRGSIFQRSAFDAVYTHKRLEKAWWRASLFCLLFILICFCYLYIAWQPAAALKWLLQAAVLNAYVLWLLWKALQKNEDPVTKILLPDLGFANWLTLVRGFLIGTLAGFLFQTIPTTNEKTNWLAWTPGIIYILAVVLDYFDGYIARITKYETRLGEWLDTKIDALGLLVAPVLAIEFGRLPIFYITVGLAYYLYQFGTWYRKKNGKQVIRLKPHPAKRMIAGFQMGLVGLALLPVFSGPMMTVAALIFMIPLLAGFLRDWLVICGFVEVGPLQQTRWDHPAGFLTTKLLPVFLRFFIGIAGILLFYQAVTAFYTGQEFDSRTWMYLTKSYNRLELTIMATAAGMIAFGIITRIAAFLISIFLAGILTTWDSPPFLFFLFSSALTLMLTGSGWLSTWHPEDKLLLEKQGDPDNIRFDSRKKD